MKQVNFKELKVKSISGKETIVDARELVAEQIYANTGGLKWKLLAEKIYKDELCVFNDEEWSLFQKAIDPENGLFNCKMMDAIEANICEK